MFIYELETYINRIISLHFPASGTGVHKHNVLDKVLVGFQWISHVGGRTDRIHPDQIESPRHGWLFFFVFS